MSKFTTKKLPQSKLTPPKSIDEGEVLPADNSKRKKIRKWIGISLIILGCIFGINYIVQGIGNTRIGTLEDAGSTSFVPVIFEKPETSTQKPSESIENILIVGIGGSGHQAGDLADSIMLASLDHAKKDVTMISIPRDLYVNYGTGMGAGKINALYPIGIGRKEGVSLLANKVSEVTGQSIHHYMVIDFTAFRYIVDALGGIDINVEKDLYDREYPDYNYGYITFSVKKGLQTFDGETALRYARSRHSTSDIDRSRRQQQIINAIKTKSLSAGVITSPTKISELINATRKNINTDLTVSDIVEIGTTFASIEKSNINVYNLGNDCVSYINCSTGAYLYNPSMSYFGGAWAVIPEGARVNKLSYYDRIHRFVDFVFRFSGIHTSQQPIVLVGIPSSLPFAKNLLMEFRKIGINFDTLHVLNTATGTIEQSHINIYWNEDFKVGISPDSDIVEALKMLDESIPVHFIKNNEYITNNGPKIEIVLGKDYKSYFEFAKPVEYLPKVEEPPMSSGSIVSGETTQTGIQSTKTPPGKITNQTSQKKTTPSKTPITPSSTTTSSPYKVAPGEWEDL